jgi:hypothetical protein
MEAKALAGGTHNEACAVCSAAMQQTLLTTPHLGPLSKRQHDPQEETDQTKLRALWGKHSLEAKPLKTAE